MNIKLQKATCKDYKEIHYIQIIAFKSLYEKYNDEETSPATETIERLAEKLAQDFSDYYFIKFEDKAIGFIRIVRINEDTCRISPMGILPQYQGFGFAQQTIKNVELLYPKAKNWKLDTIKEEEKLGYLYEKMGYSKTGKEEKLQQNMTIVYYEK